MGTVQTSIMFALLLQFFTQSLAADLNGGPFFKKLHAAETNGQYIPKVMRAPAALAKKAGPRWQWTRCHTEAARTARSGLTRMARRQAPTASSATKPELGVQPCPELLQCAVTQCTVHLDDS